MTIACKCVICTTMYLTVKIVKDTKFVLTATECQFYSAWNDSTFNHKDNVSPLKYCIFVQFIRIRHVIDK